MGKKNKEKKSKSSAKPMAIDDDGHKPEAMDTSEGPLPLKIGLGNSLIKKKKWGQRRNQRLRKEKAIERALCSMEKQDEKTQKSQLKLERVQSLKTLY